jgi:hypothetical protein
MDVQGLSLSTASNMDVQSESLSNASSSMDLKGVHLSSACSGDVQGVCIPFHFEKCLKCRIAGHPTSTVPK